MSFLRSHLSQTDRTSLVTYSHYTTGYKSSNLRYPRYLLVEFVSQPPSLVSPRTVSLSLIMTEPYWPSVARGPPSLSLWMMSLLFG